MKRWFVLLCVCVGIVAPRLANGQEAPGNAAATPDQAAQDPAAELKEKPDDRTLFNTYMGQNLSRIQRLSTTDPDEAEKQLAAMKDLLEALEPTTDSGKQLVERGLQVVEMFEQQIALGRVTLDELTQRLQEDATDVKSISMFASKLGMEVSPLTRDNPDKAEEVLNSAKALIASIKEKAEQDDVKRALQNVESTITALERRVETGKRLAALVGADAAPLNVQAWVNGEPLTDEDLKGKVVLLDFWAVWCGPCIATFPHLREWHEKYADKGLVIIGLTRYYNFTWDEESKRAQRATGPEKVTAEQEQEMLKKFAEQYELQYRFAIQESNELSEYYAVSGIPHVVVIDQKGKVRLIRIGSGEQTAKDISEMLEQLFEES